MSFWTKLLAGLSLINTLIPAFLAATAGVPVRIRKIKVTAGSVYEIAGAGPATAPGEQVDDLLISVR